MKPLSRRSWLRNWGKSLLLLSLALCSPWLSADSQSERRLLIGLRLFPAVLAADLDLASKCEEKLHVIVLYHSDKEIATATAEQLRKMERVRDIPLHVGILSYQQLNSLAEDPPHAIFLAQWSPDDIPALVQFGIRHRVVTFSPFSGDVSAGILAGLHVSDRLLPLINLETMKASGIRLKPLFLEIAKHDE